MGIWDQNLTGHTPAFGRTPKNGNHLVIISTVDKESESPKGPRLIVTYKVESSDDSSNVGCTVRDYLYVMGADFTSKGSDAHVSMNRDNWYHLLTALNMPVEDIPVNELADMMQGLRLGIRTAYSETKRKPAETDEAFAERQLSPFANVKAYMPASAVGSSPKASAEVAADAPTWPASEPDAGAVVSMPLSDLV
jgi:hypothetical protein